MNQIASCLFPILILRLQAKLPNNIRDGLMMYSSAESASVEDAAAGDDVAGVAAAEGVFAVIFAIFLFVVPDWSLGL